MARRRTSTSTLYRAARISATVPKTASSVQRTRAATPASVSGSSIAVAAHGAAPLAAASGPAGTSPGTRPEEKRGCCGEENMTATVYAPLASPHLDASSTSLPQRQVDRHCDAP